MVNGIRESYIFYNNDDFYNYRDVYVYGDGDDVYDVYVYDVKVPRLSLLIDRLP
jgi:hypothetical protein